jgi:hypothetical protein
VIDREIAAISGFCNQAAVLYVVEAHMVALQEQQQKHVVMMKGESVKHQSIWLERARRLREFVSEGRESQESVRTELLETQREADAARAAVAVNCKRESEVVRRQSEAMQQMRKEHSLPDAIDWNRK